MASPVVRTLVLILIVWPGACAPAAPGGGADESAPDSAEPRPAPSRVDATTAAADARAPDDAATAADLAPSPADARPPADAAADLRAHTDTAPDAEPAPFDVFALDRLHRVDVETTAEGETKLRTTREEVAVTFTYDGIRLPMSTCHRKGSYGSVSTTKPALSCEFDLVLTKQRLAGLDHLVLNNARQDPSFLNEHMAYELARRAGVAAPLTAHAIVYLNGKAQGLYVVKEAIVKDFFARNFGAENRNGNLYKAGIEVDFAKTPTTIELKNEAEELRKRDDVIAAAKAVVSSTDAELETNVGKVIDLPQFLTVMAVDVITEHLDGPLFRSNNYYLYANPKTGRFIFVPHGMDWLSDVTYPLSDELNPRLDPFQPLEKALSNARPILLSSRVRKIPALEVKFRAEVGRVIRDVWAAEWMNARIERALTTVRTNTDQTAAVRANVDSMETAAAKWRAFVTARKAHVESLLR